MLDQKEIQNIKKIKGEVRGVVFHTDLKYVEKVEGKGESEDIVKAFKELEPEFELRFQLFKGLNYIFRLSLTLNLFHILKICMKDHSSNFSFDFFNVLDLFLV